MEEEEGKREEYKRRLEEHLEKKAEKRRLFNIDEFVAEVDEILEAEVPDLNLVVRYKRLTNADLLKVLKIEDSSEQGLEILFYMLSRADPSVTREKVRKLDPIVTAKILSAIMAETPLFLTQPT